MLDHIITSTFLARTIIFLSLGLGTGNKDNNQIASSIMSQMLWSSRNTCVSCIISGVFPLWSSKWINFLRMPLVLVTLKVMSIQGLGLIMIKYTDFHWFLKLPCLFILEIQRSEKGIPGIQVQETNMFFSSAPQKWGITEVQLQQYGCQYLCSMAQATPDVREDILKLGGIRPIIAAMNNYPQDGCGWVARMAWEGYFFGGKVWWEWQVLQMLWHVFMVHGQVLYLVTWVC